MNQKQLIKAFATCCYLVSGGLLFHFIDSQTKILLFTIIRVSFNYLVDISYLLGCFLISVVILRQQAVFMDFMVSLLRQFCKYFFSK